MKLSDLDRDILDLLQNKFPISVQPFRQIADILGIDENHLIERIEILKKRGIIRRIGGIMDSRSLGLYSVLCASQVPDDIVDQVAMQISAQPGVTHNYRRRHRLNLWFTLTVPSEQEAQSILQQLQQDTGIKIYTMPADKTYKIKLSLPMQEVGDAD